ncbi:hypothetical protein ACJX0J_025015 [Zea mays]
MIVAPHMIVNMIDDENKDIWNMLDIMLEARAFDATQQIRVLSMYDNTLCPSVGPTDQHFLYWKLPPKSNLDATPDSVAVDSLLPKYIIQYKVSLFKGWLDSLTPAIREYFPIKMIIQQEMKQTQYKRTPAKNVSKRIFEVA